MHNHFWNEYKRQIGVTKSRQIYSVHISISRINYFNETSYNIMFDCGLLTCAMCIINWQKIRRKVHVSRSVHFNEKDLYQNNRIPTCHV